MVVRSRLVHSFWFATILLALLGLSAPAFAAAHGQFVPLPSVGLPTTGDVSQVAVNARPPTRAVRRRVLVLIVWLRTAPAGGTAAPR